MEGLIKEGSLGYILMKSNIICEDDIRAALEEQQQSGVRFGEALVKLGVVTQEDIDWALSNQLDIPYVRLKKEMIDAKDVLLVPSGVARQYNLIPLIRVDDELNVAFADPLNKEAIEAIERITGCHVRVSVALIREIREMQDMFYGPPLAPISFGFASTLFAPRLLEEINGDTSGAKFIDYLLAYYVQNRLMALSLQPLVNVVLVTVRRGGASREIGRLSIAYYEEFIVTLRRWCGMKDAHEVNARGILTFSFRSQRHQFNVSFLKGAGGDFVTFKLNRAAAFPARIGDLSLDTGRLEQLQGMMGKGGLVVLYHRDSEERSLLANLLLGEVNPVGKSVILIGEGLGQGQNRYPRVLCREGTHGEPQNLVTAAMEHEPDILAIEDATDSRSFIAASRAAMRGKLVLAGLAVKDLHAVIRHLLYFWHKHYVIPTYIRGIVSCRRVALLCPHCRQRFQLSAEGIAALGAPLTPGEYYRPAGCQECEQSGYSGSRILFDVIPFDQGLVDVFETARDGREVLSLLAVRGYRGSGEEGAELLRAGEITPEEYVTSILL